MKGSNVTPTDEMARTLRVLAQLMNEDGVFGSEALYQAAALLDAQAAEIDRLRNLLSEKVIDSTRLRELVFRDARLDVELEGGACALMAQAFGKQLFESGAENYIEASFESPAYPDHGRITVTVRREGGKTSHELRVIAEKQRDALAAELSAIKEQWISVSERMPEPNKKVLATYTNRLGNARRVIAELVAKHTVEDSDDIFGDDADYDKAADQYYCPAGWYECVENWDDLAYLSITEGEITHWMPLPDAPQGELK